LALVGLATALGGSYTFWPSGSSYAAGTLYRQAHTGEDHSGFRHHGKIRGHRVAARLCSDRRDHSIDAVTGFVEGFVNLTPEQTGSWNALTQAVSDGSAMIGKACEDVDVAETATAAPQKLEQIEALLQTSLSVVQRVRPAMIDFYDVLSDSQKKALDGLIAQRRGHHRH
jgi:hypothetical protein